MVQQTAYLMAKKNAIDHVTTIDTSVPRKLKIVELQDD